MKHKDKDNPTTILQNNFLFQASLSSKELFHSNMIAWLLEQKCKDDNYSVLEKFIYKFADQEVKLKDNQFKIQREKNNIDILIEWEKDNKNHFIFIENKFKSLPNQKQLIKYNDKIEKIIKLKIKNLPENRVIKFFLLTPLSVIDFYNDKIKNWENISYQIDIIPFLKDLTDLGFVNEDIFFVIQKYIEFLEQLNELFKGFNLVNSNMSSFGKNNYDLYAPESKNEEKLIDQVKKIRLRGLILKIYHNNIGNLLRLKLKKLENKYGYQIVDDHPKDIYTFGNIFITSGFTRSEGLTDIKICFQKNLILGLQLQGNSLKFLTEVFGGKTLQDRNIKFANNLFKKGIWFHDKEGNQYIGNGRNKQLKVPDHDFNFNSYTPNFIYLKKDASEYENRSIEELTDFMIAQVVKVFIEKESFVNAVP